MVRAKACLTVVVAALLGCEPTAESNQQQSNGSSASGGGSSSSATVSDRRVMSNLDGLTTDLAGDLAFDVVAGGIHRWARKLDGGVGIDGGADPAKLQLFFFSEDSAGLCVEAQSPQGGVGRQLNIYITKPGGQVREGTYPVADPELPSGGAQVNIIDTAPADGGMRLVEVWGSVAGSVTLGIVDEHLGVQGAFAADMRTFLGPDAGVVRFQGDFVISRRCGGFQ